MSNTGSAKSPLDTLPDAPKDAPPGPQPTTKKTDQAPTPHKPAGQKGNRGKQVKQKEPAKPPKGPQPPPPPDDPQLPQEAQAPTPPVGPPPIPPPPPERDPARVALLGDATHFLLRPGTSRDVYKGKLKKKFRVIYIGGSAPVTITCDGKTTTLGPTPLGSSTPVYVEVEGTDISVTVTSGAASVGIEAR